MIFTLIQFVMCTGLILYCGQRVARYGDAIAEKTGLSGYSIMLITIFIVGAYINFILGNK
jgi:hypothetical protein